MCNQTWAFVPEKRLMCITLCAGLLGFVTPHTHKYIAIGNAVICLILAFLQFFFCFCRITPGVETDYIPMDPENSAYYCCGECGCRSCYCNTSWMSVGSLLSIFICMAGGGFAAAASEK